MTNDEAVGAAWVRHSSFVIRHSFVIGHSGIRHWVGAMIWFACKDCGKRHQRPVEAAGTLVFCSCGAGNRVPWESTVPAPEQPEEPVPAVPTGGGRRRAEDEEDADLAPRRRGRPEPRPRDPAYCFNHTDVPSVKTCDDCHEAFCERCVVPLQGRTLCGPCKNFRLRSAQRPLQLSALAVISLVVGVLSGPPGLCLFGGLVTPDAPAGMATFFGLAGTAGPLVALGFGLAALWNMNRNPKLSGRGLAVIGMAVATAGLLWCLAMLLIAAARRYGLD